MTAQKEKPYVPPSVVSLPGEDRQVREVIRQPLSDEEFRAKYRYVWEDDIPYTPELADVIAHLLASGHTWNSIAAMKGMPSQDTLVRWRMNRDDFKEKVYAARRARTETWDDELIKIADDGSKDYYTDENGFRRFDHEHVKRSELRVKTRQWHMSKVNREAYGDRVDTSFLGLDGKPITPQINILIANTKESPTPIDGSVVEELAAPRLGISIDTSEKEIIKE